MKKIIILFLAAVIVILPFSSLYGEEVTLIDRFLENDSMLANYTEKYESLVEEREEKLEYYENYRINRRSIFNIALGYAARENGLLQVDWDIHNAFYDMKAREALLEINFRNILQSVYSKFISTNLALKSSNEALDQYNETLSNNSKGYVSDVELLEAQYNYKKADNTYLAASRQADSSLRSFCSLLGYTVELSDLDFDFSEEMQELQDLTVYLESAVRNSSSMVLIRQSIERYETELKYLDKYVISENLTYYKSKKDSVETNLAISLLTLEKNELELRQSIEEQYNLLLIEKEKTGLSALALEIAETDYEINRDLYNRKLIDYKELTESMEAKETASREYALAVYKYNTMLMELEYDCALFMPEDE